MIIGMCKEYDTVVLSVRSDVVNNIATAIDIVTKERYGKSVVRTIGNDETDVTMICTKTTARTYKKIIGMIEQAYPNMCIFMQRCN